MQRHLHRTRWFEIACYLLLNFKRFLLTYFPYAVKVKFVDQEIPEASSHLH